MMRQSVLFIGVTTTAALLLLLLAGVTSAFPDGAPSCTAGLGVTDSAHTQRKNLVFLWVLMMFCSRTRLPVKHVLPFFVQHCMHSVSFLFIYFGIALILQVTLREMDKWKMAAIPSTLMERHSFQAAQQLSYWPVRP